MVLHPGPGAMRQATFFRVGTTLPVVRQHTLHYRQGSQLWSTDTQKVPIPDPRTRREPLSLGNDLAVAVGVAIDPTADVLNHLRAASTPVDSLLVITPGSDADDQAITGPGQAVTFAQTIRDLVRHEIRDHPSTGRIHLFLAGPGGLALLLGHRWNRLRPTVVYEHVGPGAGYTKAFAVHA